MPREVAMPEGLSNVANERPREIDALATLESALFRILGQADRACCLVARDNQVVYQSPSVRVLFGEWFGSDLSDFSGAAWINPADADALQAAIERAVRSDTGTEQHLACDLKDASGFWRQFSVFLKNCQADAHIRGLLLCLKDVSEEAETQRLLRESEARFRELNENATDLVAILSSSGHLTYASPSFTWTFGYSRDELIGTAFLDYLHEDDRDFVAERTRALLIGSLRPTKPVRFRVRRKDGAWRWISGSARDCRHIVEINGLIVNARDITEEVQAEEALARAKRRQEEFREHLWRLSTAPNAGTPAHLKRILTTAGIALRADRVSYWRYRPIDPAFVCEMMVVVGSGELDASAEGEVVSARENPPYFQSILANRPITVSDVRTDPNTYSVAQRLESLGIGAMLDQPVWLQNSVRGAVSFEALHRGHIWEADERDFAANMASMVALYIEAAERREVEVQLERLAWFDSLTGLANRAFFQKRLQQVLNAAEVSGSRFALLLVDLDRFKDLNDTMGHQAGDELLIRVADHLRRSVESSVKDRGFVCRMGGDEFVILLNDLKRRDEATRLARTLLQSVRSEHMLKTLEIPVTSSVGIALYPDHGRDASTLFKNADAAMYDAKREGRDNYQFYNPVKHDRTLRSLRMDSDLRFAVEHKALELHYQPIVDLSTGQLVGFEALVRIRHPERGLLSPEEFITVAEESGAIELLSRWVLAETCAQIASWRDKDAVHLPISINLSGTEFRNRRLVDFVSEAIEEFSIDPQQLAIEITERTLVDDTEIAMGMVNRLSALGVKIVVDDFGVGYSALSYLKRLPVDRIKLDKTFVSDLPADPDSAAITQAIVSMAHHLHLGIVAEGIENRAQATYLRSIGCPYGQGYFFSPPLPAKEVPSYLARYQPVLP